MSVVERDIDCVLITGAGASCFLGVEGHRIPLMADWSRELVRKLATGTGYVQVTGLRREMDGNEFEAQLGKFLRGVLAFEQVESVVSSSRSLSHSNLHQCFDAVGVLEAWYESMKAHHEQIEDLIHQSLYDLFGEPRFDLQRAQASYADLLGALGIGRNSRWVLATTNYDPIAETVIRELDYLPDWGEPPEPSRRSGNELRVDGLLGGLPRYVPVLHLHGRVGWYFQPDGSGTLVARSTDAVKHQKGFGVPIVMLPDPEKTYDGTVIESLWGQFEQALQRAKRVFVLGHSLNDAALVAALRNNLDPRQIAVSVLADPTDPSSEADNRALVERLTGELRINHFVPVRFGEAYFDKAPGIGRPELNDWLELVAAVG